MLLKKRIISAVLGIVMIFTCTAIPAMATENIESNTVEHSITVAGTLYDVSIEYNSDGTKTVTVNPSELAEESITWTIGEEEEEEEESVTAFNVRRTNSYKEYRYIYNSTAANVWNLYRMLQDDGSPWAKGVSRESGYCESFAEAVDDMVAAEDRISEYMLNSEYTTSFEEKMLLYALGGQLDKFLVSTAQIPAIIAAAVVVFVTEYAIPSIYEYIIQELIENEYYNIRDLIGEANYYFDLA